MVFKQIISALLAVSVLAKGNDQKNSTKSCRALAMSGGGSKGSYEAGVLYGLVNNDPDKTKYAYDVVTGVSAGSINTLAVSLFAPGDETNMTQFMSDTWANLEEKDVFTNWKPLGIITGITQESGIFDDSPLYNTLSKIYNSFPQKIQRKITLSCVDVNTGNYHLFNETVDDIVKAAVSSSSIPFAFPNQQWPDGLICMDGGTVWNTNLVSAVERCREQVDDDSQITLDVIVCDQRDFPSWQHQSNAYSNFLRFKDIKDFYQGVSDIYDFVQAYPNINFRHYITPSEPLAGALGILDFNNATMTWPMQMVGRLDGENALKDGDGFMFQKFDEWKKDFSIQKKFPKIGDYIREVVKSRSLLYRKMRREQLDDQQTQELLDQPQKEIQENQFIN